MLFRSVALLATGICSPQVIQADQTATTESTQVQTEQSEVQKVEENSKVETSQVDVESTTDSERSENTTIGATSKETEAAQTTELTAQEDTEKTLVNVESETEPVQKEETKQLVERKQGNDWYLIDKETGEKATGFQRLEEQAKTVYYNNEGKMQYGWQWVNNATHYFDTFNGAMAIGEKNINGHWYLFDRQGQMQRGFQELDQYGQNKTVYYNDQGHMLYGQQRIANKWYNFDTFDGAMKTGFQYIAGQNKWVYYAVDGNNRGQMQYGFQNIAGKTYYFDTFNGAQSKLAGFFDNVAYLKETCGYIDIMDEYDSFIADNSRVYRSADIGRSCGAGAAAIEFEHVSFRYPGSGKMALEDVSFQIAPGEKVSFVGSNGEIGRAHV